jgi:broad-specificity NMP kinase
MASLVINKLWEKRNILLTGLPGVGKSTWAKAYPCSGVKVVLCPDNFLMVDGVYRNGKEPKLHVETLES